MASADKDALIECGCCYENDDVRQLPCSHRYCVECLTKDSTNANVIRCPSCRKVYERSASSLPSAGKPDKSLCCDVCKRKSEQDTPAVVYCVDCQKKFCKKHHESHNDALDDHKRITMAEYVREHRKITTRYCERHTKQVLSLGCRTCLNVFCNHCVSENNVCASGGVHDLMALDQLAIVLREHIDEKKAVIHEKEQVILGVIKQSTKDLSAWDTETNGLVRSLHNVRDAQLKTIKAGYDSLEMELVRSRNQSKDEMGTFVDTEYGTRLDKISRGLPLLDARLHDNHLVDIVSDFVATDELATELMDMSLPGYVAKDAATLMHKGDLSEIELELKKNDKHMIEGELVGSKVADVQPSALQFVKRIDLNYQSGPSVMYQHADLTYIAFSDGSIIKFKPSSGSIESMKTPLKQLPVLGLAFHQKKMYCIQRGIGACACSVVAQTSQLEAMYAITKVTDCHAMDIVGDKIIIANKSKQVIHVLSLKFVSIRDIKCLQWTQKTLISLIGFGDDSAIVSDMYANRILRVNVNTGQVLWNLSTIKAPVGIVSYGRRIIVSLCETSPQVIALDPSTGKIIGEPLAVPRADNHLLVILSVWRDVLVSLCAAGGSFSLFCHKIRGV